MKKHLLILFTIFATVSLSFAGDAAAFVDLGLSEDGKTYVFAEYGKTDRDIFERPVWSAGSGIYAGITGGSVGTPEEDL